MKNTDNTAQKSDHSTDGQAERNASGDDIVTAEQQDHVACDNNGVKSGYTTDVQAKKSAENGEKSCHVAGGQAESSTQYGNVNEEQQAVNVACHNNGENPDHIAEGIGEKTMHNQGLRQIFRFNTRVEVCSNDEGFKDAWYEGKIVGLPIPPSKKKRKALDGLLSNFNYLVEYDTLLAEEGSLELLRERVDVAFMRPLPPEISSGEFGLNDVVDAYHRDGWWTGVIVSVFKEYPNPMFLVSFQNPSEELVFCGAHLRFHLDWVDQEWIRPPKKENVLVRPWAAKDNSYDNHNVTDVAGEMLIDVQCAGVSKTGNPCNVKQLHITRKIQEQKTFCSDLIQPPKMPRKRKLEACPVVIRSKYKKMSALTLNACNIEGDNVASDMPSAINQSGKRKRPQRSHVQGTADLGNETGEADTVNKRNKRGRLQKPQVERSAPSMEGNGNEAGEADKVYQRKKRGRLQKPRVGRSAGAREGEVEIEVGGAACVIVSVDCATNEAELPTAIPICSDAGRINEYAGEVDIEAGGFVLEIVSKERTTNELEFPTATPINSGGTECQLPEKESTKPPLDDISRTAMDLAIVVKDTQPSERADVNSFEQLIKGSFGDINIVIEKAGEIPGPITVGLCDDALLFSEIAAEVVPEEDRNYNLPFVKSSDFWELFDSMEVFKKMPQRPHFSPLENEKEVLREGLAVGHMVTFVTVLNKISKLKFDGPRSDIDDILETLNQLNSHGFDVQELQVRVNKLLSKNDVGMQLLKEFEEKESKLAREHAQKNEIEKDIDDMNKKLEELQDKLVLKHAGITELQSELNEASEKICSVQQEFEKLVTSLW